jgi:hypothetical protein
MISEKTARRFITCGWVAALIGALGAGYIGIVGSNPMNFLVAGVFLAMSYGIYHASRVCAVITLVFYVLQRLGMHQVAVRIQQARGGGILVGFWISVTLFTVLYALGVIGTFAWHARRATGASPDSSASTRQ